MFAAPRTKVSTASPFALLHYEPFCYSDAGAGDGGASSASGNPAASTPPNDAAASTSGNNIDWGQFNQGLNQLGETLATRLDALRGDVNQLPAHLVPPVVEPTPDLDAMTQAELATHITGSVLKSIEAKLTEMLAPLTQQITTVQQNVTTREVTQEVNTLRERHKDFNDWKPEMIALSKQHPTLGISQLYSLARADNTAKAKELDTKYNPPAPPPAPRWGGLLGNTSSSNGSTPQLSRAEASREAYREVASRHPGVLAALENL